VSAEAIARALQGKKSGSGWQCHCPAHDDHNASFSVTENMDGKILVKCQAGCDQDRVVDELKSRGLWPNATESRPNGHYKNGKGEHDWFAIPVPSNVRLPDGGCWPDGAAFPDHKLGSPSSVIWFHDASGAVMVGECRFELESGKKYRPLTYCQRDDGRGRGWHWKNCPHPRPLFDLPALLSDSAKQVLVTEGARKAEIARELFPDFAATAPLFGAHSPKFSDWSPVLGRNVVIWPDKTPLGPNSRATLPILPSKLAQKRPQSSKSRRIGRGNGTSGTRCPMA
jgi:hypothetical protein